MNNFLKEFKDRGYYYQCTNELELSNLLNKESTNAYIGFDSTAPSLHVGSLLQIMCLRLLQKHGHRPIVLLGGGTTRIGDPSGKEETRKILSEKQIESNINNIKKIFKIFLKTNNSKLKPIFVNNYKWLSKLNYIDFLRDIGKHFTINKMLTFDSVKLRLEREQSLSYMEFNYMILQAYDFLELNKNKNCIMQIGGSDQWGNIVNGVELIKRYSGKQSFGLTTPLITLASGAKMGKTESGAVWLDKSLGPVALKLADSEGMARTDEWAPGIAETYCSALPNLNINSDLSCDSDLDHILNRAVAGEPLNEQQIVRLFSARNLDFQEVSHAANELRQKVVGDEVKYAVNRNINYTNVCYFGCTFCAFSKGKTAENLRGKPYDLVIEEIVRRAEEAWERGATEVCLQGLSLIHI